MGTLASLSRSLRDLSPPAAGASRAASAPLTAFFMVAAILGLDYGARRGGPQRRASPPCPLLLPVGAEIPQKYNTASTVPSIGSLTKDL